MVASNFLLSFILFFQVQMESIRQSGFYQLVEKKYPTCVCEVKEDRMIKAKVKKTDKCRGDRHRDCNPSIPREQKDGGSNSQKKNQF